MSAPFEALQVTENVYWVGAVDWGIREFHGYATQRGTTYNAFLVMADKVALIDTVKAPYRREMMTRIGSVVDPQTVDLIISNHSEMDHSGCLPETIATLKPEAVYASKKGVEALESHFGLGDRLTPVATGETVDLGSDEVTFVETPMLHWPDSMVSYLAGEKVLFAQDAFGQHLASAHMWADEVPQDVLAYEAAKYYANIVLPFSPMVAKTVEKLREMDLDLEVIAPDHGPLYRKDLDWIVGRYAEWAEQKPTRKAVVVFDTMWQSDTLMAKAVAEGLAEGGATPVKVMPMGSAHRSDVATEILEAGVLVAGSPTINQQMFPTMADVLCYLAGLKRKNLIGAVFGSYGWSGGAARKLQDRLAEMNVDLVADPVTVQYVPTESDLEACRDLGRRVAEANLKRLSGWG